LGGYISDAVYVQKLAGRIRVAMVTVTLVLLNSGRSETGHTYYMMSAPSSVECRQRKLDHLSYSNAFNFVLVTFVFMSNDTVKWYAFPEYTPY
jgi:hypothetical protein